MKKVLFVIESLACAGAEKSLVNLLNEIDRTKYKIYLQLFSYGGEYEKLLPDDVTVLPGLKFFDFCAGRTGAACPGEFLLMMWGRIRYSVSIRLKKLTNPQKAWVFWRCARRCFCRSQEFYDIAVAYAQGAPTFYVADRVDAGKKFAWVNVSYDPGEGFGREVSAIYENFDGIACVSESARDAFCTAFPDHSYKCRVIYDMINAGAISRMALLPSNAAKLMRNDGWRLLTVGRLAYQKGYDIAIKACMLLKERGVDFCWYVLGRGPLESDIREMIRGADVCDRFILLGTDANPYPYFRLADIYVQTSRHEGFGIAIAEARALNVPVVTTRFDAVNAQMKDGDNGLVVDISPVSVADGIYRLMCDQTLYSHISQYQMSEKKDNTDEIRRLYSFMGEC